MSHKTVGRKLANVDRDLNSSSWSTSNYLALLITSADQPAPPLHLNSVQFSPMYASCKSFKCEDSEQIKHLKIKGRIHIPFSTSS